MSATESNGLIPAGDLVPADQGRIEAIEKTIKLDDPSLSITYGTETMQNISHFADNLLGRVQAKDSGEVGTTLTDLMVRVKGVDVSEIAQPAKGGWRNLPIIGSLFGSAERTMARFNTLAEQVSVISDKLEDAMVGLLHDIATLEGLYKENENFHHELSLYIEAGKRRLAEARNVELPKMQEQAAASNDSLSAQRVKDFAEQINRFERRLHDLQLSRTITLQTAPQIRLIQSNNQALAEKIQTSVLSTIPIWKSQMVLALSLQGQKNAAQLQKSVSDTTNDMLRKNAEMLGETAVATAREVERSIVDVETLRDVHNKLISTIEETMQIAAEGRAKRAAAEKELAGMEEELKQQLVSLAVKKSRQTIESASGGKALPESTAEQEKSE